jgi:hypothetical protein
MATKALSFIGRGLMTDILGDLGLMTLRDVTANVFNSLLIESPCTRELVPVELERSAEKGFIEPKNECGAATANGQKLLDTVLPSSPVNET